MEKLKVGDLVACHYDYHSGIGYAKVIKILDCKNNTEVQEYGPVITGNGDLNSKLDITIKIIGHDLFEGNEYDLVEVIEVDEERVVDPHSIYRVITEQDINFIKQRWDDMVNKKLGFLHKHVNRDVMTGKKMVNGLKLT